jgi:hypothetical protein
MGRVAPRPGTPPSGSDSRLRVPVPRASPGGPGIAVARCPDPGQPRTTAGSPARRTPPRPSKRTAHRLTCVLAAQNRVPGDPSDPDPLCRRAGHKESAITEHARRRGEEHAGPAGRPGMGEMATEQPRPSGAERSGPWSIARLHVRPRTADEHPNLPMNVCCVSVTLSTYLDIANIGDGH